MTQQDTNSERQSRESAAQSVPAFKPVALPALAAAMRAARGQKENRKAPELPAILRKESILGQ